MSATEDTMIESPKDMAKRLHPPRPGGDPETEHDQGVAERAITAERASLIDLRDDIANLESLDSHIRKPQVHIDEVLAILDRYVAGYRKPDLAMPQVTPSPRKAPALRKTKPAATPRREALTLDLAPGERRQIHVPPVVVAAPAPPADPLRVNLTQNAWLELQRLKGGAVRLPQGSFIAALQRGLIEAGLARAEGAGCVINEDGKTRLKLGRYPARPT